MGTDRTVTIIHRSQAYTIYLVAWRGTSILVYWAMMHTERSSLTTAGVDLTVSRVNQGSCAPGQVTPHSDTFQQGKPAKSKRRGTARRFKWLKGTISIKGGKRDR